jgi:hypothetical protein
MVKQNKVGNLKRAVRLIFGIMFLALFCNMLQAQAQRKPALEYQVKAAFLFNFTKFVIWPASAFKADDAPFVIGIFGNDPFGPYLDELVKGESLDTHPIIVQRYTNINEISGCHLLFVNTNQPTQQQIITLTGTVGTLTVSDADGFVKRGGSICFFKQDNKIRIEINVAATKNSKLEISSKLLSIAKIN